MDKFREFEGKDLDDCIRQACDYFNAPREKLELEIIQDAKSGIFGIVLARKAKIRARRVQLADAVQDILKQVPAVGGLAFSGMVQSGHFAGTGEKAAVKKSGKAAQRDKMAENIAQPQKGAPRPRRGSKAPQAARAERETMLDADDIMMDCAAGPDEEEFELCESGEALKQPEELDRQSLVDKAVEIVGRLTRPLAGHEVSVSASVEHGCVHARVAWQGDAGLLIGREGQTLAALQYLASRMLSRAFNAALRVQLDIGEYRSRQDGKLRALALSLAEKARQSGKSFSTRPLSSYHRRIIHLALQDQADLITRSSGDGPMKRVVISARKSAEN